MNRIWGGQQATLTLSAPYSLCTNGACLPSSPHSLPSLPSFQERGAKFLPEGCDL